MLALVRKAAALAVLAIACSGTSFDSLDAPAGRDVASAAVSALRVSGLLFRPARSVLSAALASALDVPRSEPPAAPAPGVPVATLTDTELRARLRTEPGSLETMSVGRPSRGALFNAAQMKDSAAWHVVDPEHAWAAPETIESLGRAIDGVRTRFSDTPTLYVGQISSEYGGYLRPHRSHQSGRDVDLGYYYRGGTGWYARATAKNLDVQRTWALVEGFANDPNVEAIFMDRSVQRLLAAHAASRGVPPERLKYLFEGGSRRGDHLVRHEWGHLTHLHVRFKCPNAQAAGERFLTVTGVNARATGARLRSRG